MKRVYLEPGTEFLLIGTVNATYKGGGFDFEVDSTDAAEWEYYNDETDTRHTIKWAFDLPKEDPKHMMPYYDPDEDS